MGKAGVKTRVGGYRRGPVGHSGAGVAELADASDLNRRPKGRVGSIPTPALGIRRLSPRPYRVDPHSAAGQDRLSEHCHHIGARRRAWLRIGRRPRQGVGPGSSAVAASRWHADQHDHAPPTISRMMLCGCAPIAIRSRSRVRWLTVKRSRRRARRPQEERDAARSGRSIINPRPERFPGSRSSASPNRRQCGITSCNAARGALASAAGSGLSTAMVPKMSCVIGAHRRRGGLVEPARVHVAGHTTIK